MGPVAGEPRHEVLQLSQLDLQLAFPGAGPLGEDIEDERCAVDDLRSENLFQISGLGPGEFFVEEDSIGIGLLGGLGELLGLARPNERARVRCVQPLGSLPHHRHPSRVG